MTHSENKTSWNESFWRPFSANMSKLYWINFCCHYRMCNQGIMFSLPKNHRVIHPLVQIARPSPLWVVFKRSLSRSWGSGFKDAGCSAVIVSFFANNKLAIVKSVLSDEWTHWVTNSSIHVSRAGSEALCGSDCQLAGQWHAVYMLWGTS